jgi:hypothetical protein
MTELEKLEKAEKHGLGFWSRLLKRDHRLTGERGRLIGLLCAKHAFLAGWESEQAPLVWTAAAWMDQCVTQSSATRARCRKKISRSFLAHGFVLIIEATDQLGSEAKNNSM